MGGFISTKRAVPSERVLLIAAWAVAVCSIWAAATAIGAHVQPKLNVPFPRSPVEVLASWDGQNFKHIAQGGYSTSPDSIRLFAFFPALPMIARLLGGAEYAPLAGILLSQLAFLACMMMLSAYAPQREHPGLFRQPGFWMLVSPVGFFFLAFYTESIFLLAVLAMAAAVRQQKTTAGTVAGILAGLTRPAAIIAPLLVTSEIARNRRGFLAFSILVVAPVVGIAIYVAFVAVQLSEPLGYIHIQQQSFGRYGSGQLSFPFAGDVRELRSLFEYAAARRLPPLDIPVSLLSTASVMTLVAVRGRRMERSFLLYSLGALLFIHTVTSPASSARYELMIFPVFIAAADLLADRPRLALAAVLFSIPLEAALFHKFATWEFVA